jgi:hypothetical protein
LSEHKFSVLSDKWPRVELLGFTIVTFLVLWETVYSFQLNNAFDHILVLSLEVTLYVLIKLLIPAWHWWLMMIILASWEVEIGKITVWGKPRQIVQWDPISKVTRAKWTGGVAQVLEFLLWRHEALSSNSSPIPPPKR